MDKTRIENACKMLRETNYPVGDIAKFVGFHSAQSLLNNFHKFQGIAPVEYHTSATKAQAKRYFEENKGYSQTVFVIDSKG